MKNYFLNWFKNCVIDIKTLIYVLFGIVILLVEVAGGLGAIYLAMNFISLISSILAEKFSYSGFAAPYIVVAGIVGFIYKHIKDEANYAQEKMVPVLEDLIRLSKLTKMNKEKKDLINKLSASILLTNESLVIEYFELYLSENDDMYLKETIAETKNKIRRKTDFMYLFGIHLEKILNADKIKKLQKEKKQL